MPSKDGRQRPRLAKNPLPAITAIGSLGTKNRGRRVDTLDDRIRDADWMSPNYSEALRSAPNGWL